MGNRTIGSKRVLIVDDEPSVTMTLASALEKLGDAYVIDTTNTSNDVLPRLKQANYALMITDYKMPGMNGIDLAQAVQNISPQTRIILMTAYGSVKVTETAKNLRFDGYLDKPFTVAQIREMVAETISDKIAFKRILILEDNADLRRLYKRTLTHKGYEVCTAATLQEARDLIAQYHFAVFLCDVHIGRERGTDLLREYAETLQENGTQTIMVSGDASYRAYVEELGVDFYMEKPVAIEPLVTLIKRLTQSR